MLFSFTSIIIECGMPSLTFTFSIYLLSLIFALTFFKSYENKFLPFTIFDKSLISVFERTSLFTTSTFFKQKKSLFINNIKQKQNRNANRTRHKFNELSSA